MRMGFFTDTVSEILYKNYSLGWTMEECERFLALPIDKKVKEIQIDWEDFIDSHEETLTKMIMREIQNMVDWEYIAGVVSDGVNATKEELEMGEL